MSSLADDIDRTECTYGLVTKQVTTDQNDVQRNGGLAMFQSICLSGWPHTRLSSISIS